MSSQPSRPSRYGERLTTRRLVTRHATRLGLLATLVGRTPDEAQRLARQAVRLARHEGGEFDEALVRAFSRLSVTLPHASDARGRLALLLVDVERRPDDAARLLDLAPEGLAEVLTSARRTTPDRPCRGWGLASRRPGLTEAEQEAGAAHLALCRRCRDRLTALERTRAQVLGGSAGVVGAVAGAQLFPWGGAAGTLVTGKTAAGVIGAVGAAVLATGGATVAADRVEPHRVAPVHAPATQPPVARQDPQPAPRGSALPRPAPSTVPGPTHVPRPLPLPAAPSTVVPDVPVPAAPLLPKLPELPKVPLPSLPALPDLPGPLSTPLNRLLDLP